MTTLVRSSPSRVVHPARPHRPWWAYASAKAALNATARRRRSSDVCRPHSRGGHVTSHWCDTVEGGQGDTCETSDADSRGRVCDDGDAVARPDDRRRICCRVGGHAGTRRTQLSGVPGRQRLEHPDRELAGRPAQRAMAGQPWTLPPPTCSRSHLRPTACPSPWCPRGMPSYPSRSARPGTIPVRTRSDPTR